MRNLSRTAVMILGLLWCVGTWATGKLGIEHAWARPTPPGATVAAVYLRIVNQTPLADRLLGVDTPLAQHVAVHTSRIVAGVMQMREVDSVDCPAGAVLDSAPGGMHLMLMGITQALKSGEHFPLSLHFREAGTILLDVAVEASP